MKKIISVLAIGILAWAATPVFGDDGSELTPEGRKPWHAFRIAGSEDYLLIYTLPSAESLYDLAVFIGEPGKAIPVEVSQFRSMRDGTLTVFLENGGKISVPSRFKREKEAAAYTLRGISQTLVAVDPASVKCGFYLK